MKQQSGSIVVFAIVSVLLVGGFIGAIIMAQNRAQDVVGSTPPVAEQKPDQAQRSQSDEDRAAKQEAERESEQKRQAEAKQKAEAAKQEAAREAEAKERELAEQAARAEREAHQPATQQPAAGDGPMARTGGVHASGLPETGPIADAFAATFGVVAIFGASYVYYHYGRRP